MAQEINVVLRVKLETGVFFTLKSTPTFGTFSYMQCVAPLASVYGGSAFTTFPPPSSTRRVKDSALAFLFECTMALKWEAWMIFSHYGTVFMKFNERGMRYDLLGMTEVLNFKLSY